ncbi:MAG TPA: general stress protein [Chloroflexota bacterium]|jgi:hypothetical protein|nr:general stress protein [Chloroflexota bacterium]
MATQRNVVVGVFRDSERAREAIAALKDAGFRGDDISILMPNTADAEAMAEDMGTSAGTGAATGAVAGGILGGLGGWLVGIGALAIPGVGPFIAAGALATALTGAAIGAGVGAIAGALIGLGIPEEEAHYYEEEVRGGRTLVAVRADGRYDEAQRVLRHYGAYDIQTREAGSVTYQGAAATSPLSATDPMAHPPLSPEAAAYAATQSTSAPMPTDERWADAMPQFRSRWEARQRGEGDLWERHERVYAYGWEVARQPRFQGQSWSDAEPELQRDWERRYPDRPWQDIAGGVREAWEDVRGGSDRR